MLVIGVIYVPYLARPLRAQMLALRERPFVEAARACGPRAAAGDRSGAAAAPVVDAARAATVLVANAVVLESALSFLGAGVGPPEPSLGTLIAAGVDDVGLSPHLLIVPCVALVLLVLSLSGLRRRVATGARPPASSPLDLDAAHD